MRSGMDPGSLQVCSRSSVLSALSVSMRRRHASGHSLGMAMSGFRGMQFLSISAYARLMRSRGLPAATKISQGWVLAQDGAWRAGSSIVLTRSALTGLCLKARIVRRCVKAIETSMGNLQGKRYDEEKGLCTLQWM